MLIPLLALACAPSTVADAPAEAAPPPEDTGGGIEWDWDTGAADDSGPPDTGDGGVEDTSSDTGWGDTGDTGSADDGETDYERCFELLLGEEPGPDYDQFSPTIGSHCYGTDHQDIQGIERVVFLGDSVTVGTPPTGASDWYRNELTDALASAYGLERPSWFWENVNLFSGTTYIQDSGDFASCAEWGARTDDLMQDNSQVEDCLPEDQRDKTTLVVMTIGGNDLNSLTEGFMEGESTDDLWTQTFDYMALVREAVEWLKEPERFPNGVYVIFTNLYEFTDGTGDVTSCPIAELAGYGEAITDPALEEMVLWSMEEFMSIAVDTETDMLFLLESFCGHGFNYDDPEGRCYREEEAELWFDLTCIHPNATGHGEIAEMFMSVVEE